MALTLADLHGRIGDLDSHESIPVPRYPEVFGEVGRRFFLENGELWRLMDVVTMNNGGVDGESLTVDRPDDTEITHENVWTLKGVSAPGAIDMDRRPAVMEAMGIKRQLIFPMMGLVAWLQAEGGNKAWGTLASPEQMALGKLAMKTYNEWAGRLTKKYVNRMNVVGLLPTGEPEMTPELLVSKAEELIDNGCRAIMIASGKPPAGLPPGDRNLDPFYATLAKAGVTLTFHPPSGAGYRSSEVWEHAVARMEFATATTLHNAEENFIAAMVLSGLFDRHPTLRVAVVETGASWVGPLAERLDCAVNEVAQWRSALSMTPSEFLSRNVRVSVAGDEPIEVWMERHHKIQDVYCYASDYPHPEGKPWSLQNFYKRLAPLGDDIVEKFFVTNSQLVLPDPA
jgi:predicted TIM-barrel fold metal-dependent hydrolase